MQRHEKNPKKKDNSNGIKSQCKKNMNESRFFRVFVYLCLFIGFWEIGRRVFFQLSITGGDKGDPFYALCYLCI